MRFAAMLLLLALNSLAQDAPPPETPASKPAKPSPADRPLAVNHLRAEVSRCMAHAFKSSKIAPRITPWNMSVKDLTRNPHSPRGEDIRLRQHFRDAAARLIGRNVELTGTVDQITDDIDGSSIVFVRVRQVDRPALDYVGPYGNFVTVAQARKNVSPEVAQKLKDDFELFNVMIVVPSAEVPRISRLASVLVRGELSDFEAGMKLAATTPEARIASMTLENATVEGVSP